MSFSSSQDQSLTDCLKQEKWAGKGNLSGRAGSEAFQARLNHLGARRRGRTATIDLQPTKRYPSKRLELAHAESQQSASLLTTTAARSTTKRELWHLGDQRRRLVRGCRRKAGRTGPQQCRKSSAAIGHDFSPAWTVPLDEHFNISCRCCHLPTGND